MCEHPGWQGEVPSSLAPLVDEMKTRGLDVLAPSVSPSLLLCSKYERASQRGTVRAYTSGMRSSVIGEECDADAQISPLACQIPQRDL